VQKSEQWISYISPYCSFPIIDAQIAPKGESSLMYLSVTIRQFQMTKYRGQIEIEMTSDLFSNNRVGFSPKKSAGNSEGMEKARHSPGFSIIHPHLK